MKAQRIVAGIDAGSAAVSVVFMDEGGKILSRSYGFHRGKPSALAKEFLAKSPLREVDAVALTDSAPPSIFGERIDGRVAAIEAARKYLPDIRTLLIVGAEKFTRVSFDSKGKYESLRGNSSCAAGTGSFLDSQAIRLGLKSSAELASLASTNSGAFPQIASRCSVFAKTDLIHAQQEGWKLEEICEGLCEGLARNIADTLFPGEVLPAPVFLAGGVSLNAAVARRLSALAGSEILCSPDTHLFGAIGACLRLIAAGKFASEPIATKDLFAVEPAEKKYTNPPLESDLAEYPDFSSFTAYPFASAKNGTENPVETEYFTDPLSYVEADGRIRVGLGMDIGSTSTKAVLLARDGTPLFGFYTRTAGRPLEACQAIFEAIEEMRRREGFALQVVHAATTGSGRKLAGKVFGADAIIDEITAHAKAAIRFYPSVDTIIEIGGQDSKFTSIRNGVVVFSQMNTVCAAGTGSFLEEQAARLGVPLPEYSARALRASSPLASDRCTVFMQRDLNHLLGAGYSSEELLAAALFSICDNYLAKIAREGSIGARVTFQGATAKNRALVAAFERRLGKPIHVSRFCHLTGAIGAVLQAEDEAGGNSSPTRFKGFGLGALEIESRNEVCGLCTNRCRLRIVKIGDDEEAFGFQCGREYGTKKFVAKRSLSFDLVKRRIEIADSAFTDRRSEKKAKQFPRIGVPTALYMSEDSRFWRRFFQELGFPCDLAPDNSDTLKLGKSLAGAEFCAPMAMMYGQVHKLLETCDYVFLPVYLEERPEGPGTQAKEGRREYCNYSQYASVVVPLGLDARKRMLSPLLKGRSGDESSFKKELEKTISKALRGRRTRKPSDKEIRNAYEFCRKANEKTKRAYCELFLEESDGGEPAVILAGRPYEVFSTGLSKGIPEMIADSGTKAFFQDMIPDAESDPKNGLLSVFHWNYAAKVIKTALFCARTPRFYPVLISSFKCSPDSFAIEYFKRILDAAGKPYLVLQIDEHDSSVGYETRVEAGIRAFRNHFAGISQKAGGKGRPDRGEKLAGEAEHQGTGLKGMLSSLFSNDRGIRGKTILFPNWDPITCSLLAANLRASAIDAHVLRESEESIRRSMTLNSGQCVPINAIAYECAEYVREHKLDPSKTVVWMIESYWSCNIHMYPPFIKLLLEKMGGGMEGMEVYPGTLYFLDVSPRAMLGAYFAYLAGGTLGKLVCRVRPYEKEKGATDRAREIALKELVAAFEQGRNREKAIRHMYELFREIPIEKGRRPKVAIFGDFYARDNEVFNQDLCRFIEANGGEVVVTPYLEYLKAVTDSYFRRMLIEKNYSEYVKLRAAFRTVSTIDRAFFLKNRGTFSPPSSWKNRRSLERIEAFGMRPEHDGECFENTLKIFRILEEHSDIALFVQTNPAFCCPSIISEAMSAELRKLTGIPIVSITYDGTGELKNEAIAPYLAFARD